MTELPDTISIPVECPFCFKTDTIEVSFLEHTAWQSGMNIQHAMPNLSADKREQLMSGICPPCWNKMFPEE